MSATSLIRYFGQQDGNGHGVLHWGRADQDGAPFRARNGQGIPTGPEDELEARLVRTYDAKNRMFDTSDPDDNAAYLQVLEKHVNGWAKVLDRRHYRIPIRRVQTDADGVKTVTRDVKVKVYVEWTEVFMEDGAPMHSQRPFIGRSNL